MGLISEQIASLIFQRSNSDWASLLFIGLGAAWKR
jgi:hypothetical protein